MALLHLPRQHTEQELAVAGALARTLRCEELYVAWSAEAGRSRPVIPARVRAPAGAPAPARRGWLRRILRRKLAAR